MSDSTTSGANGITAQAASAGISITTGASRNGPLFALAGRMISFKSSLMASGTGVVEARLEPVGARRQQPERPDAVGPDADLDPADELSLPQREVGDAEHERR